MNVPSRLKRLSISSVILITLTMYTAVAKADTRTEYLIKMLESSSNYRLRVQAATTLGKLRSAEAIPALVKATKDQNELVIISSAIALKQIGDVTILPQLEESAKKATSAAAKSQLEQTIRILKEIGNSGQAVPKTKKIPKFLVRVDAMGNSSAQQSENLTELMRELVLERVAAEQDVILQKEKLSSEIVSKKIKREKLKGYIISGSILKLDVVDDRLVVKLGLNLFSNPDYSLLMMPTAEASINVDVRKLKNGSGKEVYRNAVKIVADSLIDTIFATLRQSGLE